ncbi:sugar-binding transcriptional regulator [Lichenibacterium dinghuense]|uniref:sugar-binding transcriptional regulator n=1 Tax=Lichenibacterium dinghuense TaxID=2895977 RepID=UPI001F24D3A3|nr:sugar-binding transcriptional regulator [Lichenibacterium sp. 6Y81]
MAKDSRGGPATPPPDGTLQPGRRSQRLRLRAAWMYHVEEMTQTAIAEALGIGRVTVVRLLSDAQALGEVRVSLSRDIAELTALERGLERRFGIGEVVVAPLSGPDADPTLPIGAAAGRTLSDLLRPGMRVGVGWGKTMIAALGAIDERVVPGLSVVSMLGGIAKVLQYNPADFAWQLSRLLGADCFLIPAPAVVDSPDTKRALVERCGLGEIFDLGRELDAVVMSVGSMGPDNISYRFGYFSEEERRSLLDAGAVGDLLYQFFDVDGALLDHPINARVMAVPVDSIRSAPARVIASGGPGKVRALLGAIRLARPTVLITDEVTATALLELAGPAPDTAT